MFSLRSNCFLKSPVLLAYLWLKGYFWNHSWNYPARNLVYYIFNPNSQREASVILSYILFKYLLGENCYFCTKPQFHVFFLGENNYFCSMSQFRRSCTSREMCSILCTYQKNIAFFLTWCIFSPYQKQASAENPFKFSEHWPWFWPYLFSEKVMKLFWYKIWVIFWSKNHFLQLRGVFYWEISIYFCPLLFISEPWGTP